MERSTVPTIAPQASGMWARQSTASTKEPKTIGTAASKPQTTCTSRWQMTPTRCASSSSPWSASPRRSGQSHHQGSTDGAHGNAPGSAQWPLHGKGSGSISCRPCGPEGGTRSTQGSPQLQTFDATQRHPQHKRLPEIFKLPSVPSVHGQQTPGQHNNGSKGPPDRTWQKCLKVWRRISLPQTARQLQQPWQQKYGMCYGRGRARRSQGIL